MKDIKPSSVYAPTCPHVAPANSEKQAMNSVKSAYAPEAVAPISVGVPASSDVHEEGMILPDECLRTYGCVNDVYLQLKLSSLILIANMQILVHGVNASHFT